MVRVASKARWTIARLTVHFCPNLAPQRVGCAEFNVVAALVDHGQDGKQGFAGIEGNTSWATSGQQQV